MKADRLQSIIGAEVTNLTIEFANRKIASLTPSFSAFADFGWSAVDGFVAVIGNVNTTHGFVKRAVQYVDSGVASPANTWEHIVWTVKSRDCS